MKPLTIEQLKALEVGDWVWVVVDDEEELTLERSAYYKTIEPQTKDEMKYFMFAHDDIKRDGLLYSTYGTKWLAYKNKEQAEAKGEIVEFPCKVRDKAWYVVNRGKLSKIEETYVKHIVIYAWGFEVEFEDTGRHLTFNFDGTIENSFNIYLDKSEAECRLAELTKE